MSAKDRDQYQGLLIPDARLTATTALWAAQSSYSQAGPRAGVPVPESESEAVLEAQGLQVADSSIDLLAVDGGPVGRTIDAAQMVWRRTGDGTNAFRGWEIPATISAWEVLQWAPTTTDYATPHIASLKADKYRDRLVVVAERTDNNSIYCWRRDPADGSWSSAVVIHSGATDGAASHPCLVEVGDRLYCLHWVPGVGEASDGRWIRVQVSEDGGATWSVARRYTYGSFLYRESGATGSESNIGRIRAAYSVGQVMVCTVLEAGAGGVGTARDYIIQCASNNLALSLDRVDAAPGGPFDLVVTAGLFVLVWVQADRHIYTARLGSAYTMLSSVTWGSTASYAWDLAAFAEVDGNTHITDADITVAADDAGILWLYARHAKTAAIGAVGEIIVAYTHSDGKNWVRVGLDSKVPASLVQTSQLWSGGVNGAQTDATHYPRHLAACWQRGRAVMVHQWYAATATTTQTSLGVAYIGGYHDLTIAPIRDGTELVDRHPWQLTRLPIERAQDTLSWTLVSSGAFANALQSVGAERFSAPGGAAGGYVYRDYAASGDDLAVLTFAAYASGAGATGTAQRAALSARIDDGARGVEVGIYMGATEFGVYDVVAGTQLGLIQSLGNNAREFRIGVYANEANSVRSCRVWYRDWNKTGAAVGDEDRRWNFVGAYALTDDGGTVGANRIKYGIFGAGASVADLDVYHGPHFAIGDTGAANCIAGSAYQWHEWATTDNPKQLSGRPLSSSPVYYADGLEVLAVDGPAHKGDSWTVKTAYEYPIERIWPTYSRSPRTRWRSTDETQQQIAVALDETLLGTDESHAGAPLYALHLSGINWRQGSLEYYTGAAWVQVAAIDTSPWGAIAFVREGATLLPNAALDHQLAGQELVGWDARIVAGDIRRVKGNRGGRWSTGATAGPRARVDLAGVTGTEAASGTVVLCPRSVTLVFEIPAATTLAGWRLVISAQDTVEGYFEIGTMMLGRVWVAGLPPDWGRRTTQILGAAYSTQQDGSTTASHPRPTGMQVEVAWPAPVDSTEFHAGGEPQYITTTATAGIEGAATWTATVYDLQGELSAAGTSPLVYLPRIERAASGDLRTLSRWHEHLLCHADRGLVVTHPLGDEGTDEQLTVASLSLEPEL
jgi:hypothetical protein